MHIVFLTSEYPNKKTTYAGIGIFVQNLARNLVSNNNQVSVVGISTETIFEVDKNVKIYRIRQSKSIIGKFIFNTWRIRKKLKEINKKNTINIIEGSELSFAFLPNNKPYKYVIRMHGGHHFFSVELNKKPFIWRSFQEKMSFKKADSLIAVSNYVGEKTKKLIGFKLPYQTIYNFIDFDVFSVSNNKKIIDNSIFFVGTVCEKKGVKQLIEAFFIVKNKIDSAKLHLIGRDWTDNLGNSYSALMKSLIPNKYKDGIVFYGSVSHNKLPDLIEQAQVCVFPSHMESFGLTVLEAMSMAKPIVFSNIPTFNELIKDNFSGLSCNPFSPEDIADKILTIFSDRKKAKKLGLNAKKEALLKFNSEAILKENINFYNTLV